MKLRPGTVSDHMIFGSYGGVFFLVQIVVKYGVPVERTISGVF